MIVADDGIGNCGARYSDPGYQGLSALEMVLHESSHSVVSPRNGPVARAIAAASAAGGREIPPREYHRHMALSRIFLDNVRHLRTSVLTLNPLPMLAPLHPKSLLKSSCG